MLSDWVMAARKHAKRTQESLGEALGVSKQNVNGWEKGRHRPSFAQLVRIAEITGHPLPEEARSAGTPASLVGGLSDRAIEVARLFDLIDPALQVHVEALVHALQTAGADVPEISDQPSPAPTPVPPPGR